MLRTELFNQKNPEENANQFRYRFFNKVRKLNDNENDDEAVQSETNTSTLSSSASDVAQIISFYLVGVVNAD
jgi:hypothetical protein